MRWEDNIKERKHPNFRAPESRREQRNIERLSKDPQWFPNDLHLGHMMGEALQKNLCSFESYQATNASII
ncbi:hypothetical protein PoB_004980400 [Plakobranchus ocellatus]|uniref:Uncharacterized protein n=1 Tax=Plakobranchus ocellatus TaxID=259542 RepID=A0AAV4BSZ6_9GAST|nr:hypothetical protein PoB_004980400 [Plakobranchus ocellatus]